MSKINVSEWWAHNGGKFDLLFLLEAAVELEATVNSRVAGGRVVFCTIKLPGMKRGIQFFDSYAVVQSSLKDAAESFQLPHAKLFTKDDYSVDTRKWDIKRLRDGCLIDCELVLELLEAVDGQVDQWGGKMRSTFSSIALSVLRAKMKEKGVALFEHGWDFSQENRACKQGYYGGRVEIFEHAPTYELAEYDVNSSYPWAMSQQMPMELVGTAKTPRALEKIMDGQYEGVLCARVSVPEMHVPPLPYRIEKGTMGGVYFPTGEWTGWYPACELRYAREVGCTVQPMAGIAYRGFSEFRSFIDEIYELKMKASGAVRMFAKLILNGCYGKFAQRPEQEVLVVSKTQEEGMALIDEERPGSVRSLKDDDFRFLSVEKFRWPKHTHYALASYVTGYARILLHQRLSESLRPAYCDSDSVHCDVRTKFKADRVGSALGQLKQERKGFTGKYYAPKIYRLSLPDGKYKYASKGFEVDAEHFEKVIRGEEVERESMQLMLTQMKKGGTVARVSTSKRWHGNSSKRFAYPDGSTRPWDVRELQDPTFEGCKSPVMEEPKNEDA